MGYCIRIPPPPLQVEEQWNSSGLVKGGGGGADIKKLPDFELVTSEDGMGWRGSWVFTVRMEWQFGIGLDGLGEW